MCLYELNAGHCVLSGGPCLLICVVFFTIRAWHRLELQSEEGDAFTPSMHSKRPERRTPMLHALSGMVFEAVVCCLCVLLCLCTDFAGAVRTLKGGKVSYTQ